MEGPYEEITVLDESGKEIIGEGRMQEIEDRLAQIAVWSSRVDPIRPLLARLEKGGRYAAIAQDMEDGKIVFVNHDATRSALAPEGLARLFGV
ncbi:MAG TPA: hypothetical protein VL283_05305 [Candidatus Baltobacteraceae bacterium]|nr:hypothetical protein [Candidatus Baltobacteraceae bacterium]